MSDDLDQRRTKIRERQLVLALEQWAPAYQHVAGGWLGYVGDIVEATAEERAWLERYVAKNGMPEATVHEWTELRRRQGREANAAATAAFLAGDYARARDLIDEARAYGAVMENEWERLHEFIAARAGQTPSGQTPSGPARVAAAA